MSLLIVDYPTIDLSPESTRANRRPYQKPARIKQSGISFLVSQSSSPFILYLGRLDMFTMWAEANISAWRWPMLHRSATYDSCSMGSGIWSTRQDTCCHSCQLFSQDGFKSEMKSFNQEKSKDCPQGSTSEERHHEPLGSNVLLSLPAPPKTTVSVRNLTLVAKNGENKLTRKIKRIRNKQGTEFKTEDSHRAQEHVDDGGDYQHDLEAAEQDRGQKVILNDVSCECYPHEMLAM